MEKGWIIWLCADIIALVILIKEIINFIQIRKDFTCKNCNTLVREIKNSGTRCPNCNRNIKIKNGSWYHFFMHRTNFIKAKKKNYVYCYDSYIKYSKIEIIISVACIVGLTSCIVLLLLGII